MCRSCNISEIFRVEYWSDLEIWVRGRSRSLKMVPIDRSCMIYYWSPIVTIALSCTVFDLFDLEIYVRGHSRSLEIVPFDITHASSYLSSIVIITVSCTVFDTERDIGQKTPIFHTPFHLRGCSPRIPSIFFPKF